MSIDAQTESIPRVSAATVTDTRVAARVVDAKVPAAGPAMGAAAPPPEAELAVREPDAEDAALGTSPEIGGEESVECIYEAGLAKLEALHDRWAAAVAEIRGAPASSEPREAAA